MAKLLGGTRIYGNAAIDSNLSIGGNADSISATTGALTVRGGGGFAGNIFAANVYTNGFYWSANGTQINFGQPGSPLNSVQFNNGGALGGSNVLYYSGNSSVVATGAVASTSTTTGTMQVLGGAGITGNVNAGGYGFFGGVFNEASTVGGVFLGNTGTGTPSPRIGLFNGNASQNWQIDNYGGDFRWFTPGVSRLTLSSLGSLIVNTAIASTSTSTGSMVSPGGAGIAGNLNVGGGIQAPAIGNVTPGTGAFTTLNTTTATATTLNATTVIASAVNSATIGNISANHVGTGTYLTSLNASNLSSGTVPLAQLSGITTTQLSGTAGITNGQLANSSITVTAGTGMSGGGTVSLGGTVTLTNAGVTGLSSSGAGNLTVSASTGSVTIGLPTTGTGALNVGSSTSIPTIVTDAYGRVISLTSNAVSTTINLTGTTGTGSISGGGTLTFSSTNGVVIAASGSTLGIDTAQDIRTSASPTFAGLTINGTGSFTGVTSITNTTNSTGTASGALVVSGGLGVAKDTYLGGNLTVAGNLTVQGNSVSISSASLSVQDPIINLHSPNDLAPLTTDDGADIGIKIHYYKGGDRAAFLGWQNSTGYLEWFDSGTDTGNVFVGVTQGTIKTGQFIASNTTASTSTTTGALVVAGGAGIAGNLNVNSAGYFGYNAALTSLVNPSIIGTSSSQAVNAGQYFVQSALINTSATGSSDIVAYPNNTTDGLTGFMDMGFTGNLFSDPLYTITKANDGYLFASARSGAGLGGNLILATDQTGTYNDIVFATGSFYANAEVARFHGNASNSGYLTISTGTAASSTSTGALRVSGGVGVTGSIYANALYTDNLRFANGNPFVSTTIANTSDITANISSGTNVGLSLSTTGVTAGNYGSATNIPTIVVDSKGRITGITTNAVSTTISLTGTSGTGSVAGGGTLTFASTNGVVASVSGSTVTISDPQDIRTSASPTFAGGTFNGNVTRSSRPLITNTTGTAAPSSPIQGDEWYNSTSGILYKYIFDGTSNVWVNMSSALFNANTGAVANTLALRDSGANLTASNFIGVASSAKYADLAELYTPDAVYQPATVVVFGGTEEVTISTESHDTRVAGVVSTNPAYLMNSELAGGVPVAFTGRVPCQVQGPVTKGSLLVTSDIPGVAQKLDNTKYLPGCVIGKALANIDNNEIATIEVAVGRF